MQGNRIGVDPTGTVALSNAFNGITIAGASSNLIGGTVSGAGNVISGNLGDGVFLYGGAMGNLIQGNFIGTDVSGQTVVSNGLAGVLIESAGNTVGGLASGARNVISGNWLDGVWLAGAGATTNLVVGNFLGTDVTGKSPLGNGRAGVGISDAPGNTIGGASQGAGNVISGNGDAGIYLVGSATIGNLIQGNKVGTDVSGLNGLGNDNEGIYVESASTNTLGGVAPGAGNLISANYEGIWLTNASWNVVLGNFIGTAGDGISPLGNTEFGVLCEVGANHNLIGGTASGAANTIAYSQTIPGHGNYAGVRVRDGAAHNAILCNSVFANAGLGIDLGPYGVNPPVPCDAGTSGQANLGQNYPVLTQAVSGPSGTLIGGALNSTPNSVFRLQFFADPLPAPSNYGQGQFWLGDTTVVTGADCNTAFVALLTNPVPAGFVISATATDAANDTSEFSADIPVLPAPALTITSRSKLSQPGQGPGQAVITWTNTAALVFQETSSLLPPIQWTASTNVPVLTSTNTWVVGLTNPPATRFYRLSFQ
jgi:titin